MPGRSYNNTVAPKRGVSVGLMQVLAAPEGQAWTPAVVDVDAPPTGFINLGSVDDSSPQLTISKEKIEIRAGIPSVRQVEFVTALAGELSLIFWSYQSFHVFMAQGGAKPVHVAIAAHATPPTVAVGASTRLLAFVSATTGFTVGAKVSTGAAAAWPTGYNTAYISKINAGASIEFEAPGLPFTPVVGDQIPQLLETKYAVGTSITHYFRLLGVSDLVNGAQVVHDFQRATARGQSQEALRAGQFTNQPVIFDLQGYPVSGYAAGTELVIAERHEFFPTS